MALLEESIPAADRRKLADSARAAAQSLTSLADALEGTGPDVPVFVARGALGSIRDRVNGIRADLAKYL